MNELQKFDDSLAKLQSDFNIQLNQLSNDTFEFHTALIELSSKYPDHKELLQFIVHINDKLEINQSIFSEIITDSFNDVIKIKREIVKKLIEDKMREENKKSFWKGLFSTITDFKDIKVLLTFVTLILAICAFIIVPDTTTDLVKTILTKTK